MNWDALGALAELTGAIAVVCTLVYLAIQIKNNTSMTKAAIRQARADSSVHVTEAFFNSPYLPEIGVKIKKGEQLSEAEKQRWGLYVQMWHRTNETAVLQAHEGLLDDAIITGIRRVLRQQVAEGAPLMVDWDWRKASFDKAYSDFVDDIVTRVGQSRSDA